MPRMERSRPITSEHWKALRKGLQETWRTFYACGKQEEIRKCITLVKAVPRSGKDRVSTWRREWFRTDWTTSERFKISQKEKNSQYTIWKGGWIYFAWETEMICNGCGALWFGLERMQNSSERNPVFSNCCQNGKIYTSKHIFSSIFSNRTLRR